MPNFFFCLIFGVLLFIIGLWGLALNRRNLITIILSIELILLSANIQALAFAAHFDDIKGLILSLLILTVAAAESAIGLSILVVYYNRTNTIELDNLNLLKG